MNCSNKDNNSERTASQSDKTNIIFENDEIKIWNGFGGYCPQDLRFIQLREFQISANTKSCRTMKQILFHLKNFKNITGSLFFVNYVKAFRIDDLNENDLRLLLESFIEFHTALNNFKPSAYLSHISFYSLPKRNWEIFYFII